MRRAIATAIIVILGLFTLSACNGRTNSDSNTTMIQTSTIETTATTDSIITQVVRITSNGEEKLETLSLSTTGWEDFLRRYPGDGGVCISNLEIDRIFRFEEVDPKYPEEIVTFLEKDKDSLMGIISQLDNEGVFFGEGFYMSYNQSQSWQWTETIEIALETKDEFVTFEINGAINGKKLYCDKPCTEYGREFLIFSKDGKLFAISDTMQMFQLIPR